MLLQIDCSVMNFYTTDLDKFCFYVCFLQLINSLLLFQMPPVFVWCQRGGILNQGNLDKTA